MTNLFNGSYYYAKTVTTVVVSSIFKAKSINWNNGDHGHSRDNGYWNAKKKKKNFFQDHGQINYTIKLNYLLPHTFSLKRTLSNYNYSNSNTQI